MMIFFFFQAEDGIRYLTVTGVQTCALPIFSPRVTTIQGKHTIVAGAQFELSYDNYLQTNTGGGLISFNGFWTQDFAKGLGTPGTGKDFADFILGYGLGIGSPLGNQTSGAVNRSEEHT